MSKCKRVIAPLTLLLFSLVPAYASITYTVTVDTSAISGVNGYIDFQFNNGGSGSQLATATVSSFNNADGVLGAALPSIGDVTGTLPGTVTIENTDGLNLYTHEFLFGSSFAFLLTLDGPAINSPDGVSLSGSSFGLSLYDVDFNALLTTNPNGDAAAIADISLDGSVTTTTFEPPAGGSAVVTFSDVVVPEPSTLSLAMGALAALLLSPGARRAVRSARSVRF